jgi:WD40 repeat protein
VLDACAGLGAMPEVAEISLNFASQVFAKPLIGAMDGHSDGIFCLARSPRTVNTLLSGAADGEIRLWDLPTQKTLRRLVGHTRAVRGIAVAADGRHAVSCSDDASVRIWRVSPSLFLSLPPPVHVG